LSRLGLCRKRAQADKRRCDENPDQMLHDLKAFRMITIAAPKKPPKTTDRARISEDLGDVG